MCSCQSKLSNRKPQGLNFSIDSFCLHDKNPSSCLSPYSALRSELPPCLSLYKFATRAHSGWPLGLGTCCVVSQGCLQAPPPPCVLHLLTVHPCASGLTSDTAPLREGLCPPGHSLPPLTPGHVQPPAFVPGVTPAHS